ncbi:hypothetical protein [Actinoplanes rectilineatus]|uniref:hypothetical protein n=1 Tax=Actinoplanes rectilineatus TaxID=113571 RepID=UPI0005F2E7D8|nr:hypothetical protein [Actinoplanes rectilineatus]
MRLSRIVAVVALCASLTGCGLFAGAGDSHRESLEKRADEEAAVTVLLVPETTEEQKAELDELLRSMGATSITVTGTPESFPDGEPQEPSEELSREPTEVPTQTTQTVKADLPDAAAVREVRDSPAAGELSALPFVSSVEYTCTTYDECRSRHGTAPSGAPS